VEWTKEEARKTIDEALSCSEGADCEVELEARTSSHTRFARNEITTSGFTETRSLRITSRKDGKSGTVTTDDLSTAGLKAAVARAEELRGLMPPDPEAVDPLPPQTYPALQKYHAESAAARARDRAPGIKATLAQARKKSLTVAGFYENSSTVRAIGNSKGNFGYHRATDVEFSGTMRTADGTGSGWAEAYSPRFSEVDPKEVARRAAEKGIASAKPREVPPGDYTVILEPAAVSDLLQALQFGMLSARAADEGRSVFSKEGGGNRIGEQVFHESVTIATDPFDPRVPATPWSGGGSFFGGGSAGLPNRRVTWAEKGVLKTLFTDRYWARKTGKEPTPFPGSLVMEGGSRTQEDLIASTEKGLLVTRFWYIRIVNPQTAQLTGLTRDGLFLIEKGKIAGPVVNLRFNESPVVMLRNVEGMGTAVPAGQMVVPPVKSREFTFTSKSDAV
jgi:predicted Zn-dependent protease